jgi:hypothetical protein
MDVQHPRGLTQTFHKGGRSQAAATLTLPGPRTVVRGARLQRATRTSTLNVGMSYTCNTIQQPTAAQVVKVPAGNMSFKQTCLGSAQSMYCCNHCCIAAGIKVAQHAAPPQGAVSSPAPLTLSDA